MTTTSSRHGRPRANARRGWRALCLPLLAVAGITAGPHLAMAADAEGNFSVRGLGGLPCERVVPVVDARGPEMAAILSWTDGALTMANQLESGVFDMVPFAEPPALLAALAVTVCRQNPRLVYAAAVSQVLQALRPLRVQRNDAPVAIEFEGARVALRRETIVLIQNRLRDRGLLRSAATGVWGPQSREAMRQFQASAGLPTTRIPDANSVLRLVLAQ